MNHVTTKHRCTAAVIIGAALATFSSNAHAQNLLINPSFESGAHVNQGGGFMLLNNGATTITGWTVSLDQIAWGTTPNSENIIPLDGSFFLDLQGPGLGGPYGAISQTMPTDIGQQYHLSFNLGTQESVSNDRGPISVAATAGATTLPFTFNPGGIGTQWGEFGFDFTATSTSTPITIAGTATTGGAYIGLDLVSVTATPEPSTTVLFLGSALAIGFVRRKRPSTIA